MTEEVWSVYKPNTGDIFRLNLVAFDGNKDDIKGGEYVRFDSHNSFYVTRIDSHPVAKILKYHKEFYTFLDLWNVFWNMITKNPKVEYLEAEWVQDYYYYEHE